MDIQVKKKIETAAGRIAKEDNRTKGWGLFLILPFTVYLRSRAFSPHCLFQKQWILRFFVHRRFTEFNLPSLQEDIVLSELYAVSLSGYLLHNYNL